MISGLNFSTNNFLRLLKRRHRYQYGIVRLTMQCASLQCVMVTATICSELLSSVHNGDLRKTQLFVELIG